MKIQTGAPDSNIVPDMLIGLTYCRELWSNVTLVWTVYGSDLANRRCTIPMKVQYYN